MPMKISQRINSFLLFLAIILASSFFNPSLAYAELASSTVTDSLTKQSIEDLNTYKITVDQATLVKGYTVSAFDKIKLSLDPGTLNQATDIEISKLNEAFVFPWSINSLSGVYQFEFKNKTAYNNKHPFNIEIKYDKTSDNLKQIFFYDKTYQSWRPLPSKDYPKEKFIRSLIYLPYARIAVFEYPKVLTIGQASWYNNKNGFFAASPDFPLGSKLRVFNADNKNKFVDVIVNDFGPNRDIHPTRVLDLDKIAFAKIAPLGQGTANIIVEPIFIKPQNNKILNVPPIGLKAGIDISSKAAVIINAESGKLIWSKLATTSLPIASLTKLISMSVFLNTKPTLNKVVSYSLADEEFNYKYANKWEVARLKVNDGDTLTIENLLYSALVGSANNAVESLARVSGLRRDEFINQMNLLATSWGASSTKFVEPTGLSPQNMSSALDYAIISKQALKNPILEKISKINNYKFTTINTKIPHTLINTNQLIVQNQLTVTGSKTGFLNEAGYCLMTRAKNKNNHQVIVVTLGSTSRQVSFNETLELANYGLNKIQ